jgi:predicted dehydrogenase
VPAEPEDRHDHVRAEGHAPIDERAAFQAVEEIHQQRERPAVGIGAEYAAPDRPDEQRNQEKPARQQDHQNRELAATARLQGCRLGVCRAGFGLGGQNSLLEEDASGAGHEGGHNSRKMKKIRAAVVGVGYLGRFHAQKYAGADGCELVAVVDARADAREKVAEELKTRAVADHRELIGQVDAVSIATTTPAHFPIARDFLAAGVHVLVEKPITETPEEARQLIDLARTKGCVLQVGHLERFNAAILAADPYLTRPRFIECHRLAPYKERGTDVNVVLDLMIHDIDLVQSIVGSPIASIDAIGTPVFSDEIDIANARIRFENGCVANATASRVSLKTERKMRVFEDDAYLSIDLQQKILTLIRKRSGPPASGQLPVSIEEQSLDQGDALKAEIESFLDCIRTGKPPVVGGDAGMRALETAMRITDQVQHGARQR